MRTVPAVEVLQVQMLKTQHFHFTYMTLLRTDSCRSFNFQVTPKFCCFFQHSDGHLRSTSIFWAGIKTGNPIILYWKRWKNTSHLLRPGFPFFFPGSFLLKYTREFSSTSSKVWILYMLLSLSPTTYSAAEGELLKRWWHTGVGLKWSVSVF